MKSSIYTRQSILPPIVFAAIVAVVVSQSNAARPDSFPERRSDIATPPESRPTGLPTILPHANLERNKRDSSVSRLLGKRTNSNERNRAQNDQTTHAPPEQKSFFRMGILEAQAQAYNIIDDSEDWDPYKDGFHPILSSYYDNNPEEDLNSLLKETTEDPLLEELDEESLNDDSVDEAFDDSQIEDIEIDVIEPRQKASGDQLEVSTKLSNDRKSVVTQSTNEIHDSIATGVNDGKVSEPEVFKSVVVIEDATTELFPTARHVDEAGAPSANHNIVSNAESHLQKPTVHRTFVVNENNSSNVTESTPLETEKLKSAPLSLKLPETFQSEAKNEPETLELRNTSDPMSHLSKAPQAKAPGVRPVVLKSVMSEEISDPVVPPLDSSQQESLTPEPSKPEQLKPGPTKRESLTAESIKPEQLKPEQLKPGPTKPEQLELEPSKPVQLEPEPTKPDQLEPEPTKPEQLEPEPTKPEQLELEPSKPEQLKPGPTKRESPTAESIKPEQLKPEPTKPEQLKPGPTKRESLTAESIKPEQLEPEPTKQEPTKPESSEPEQLEPEPTKPESLTSEPTKPEQLEPEPTKPEQLEPEPTKPEQLKPEPTKPEPTKPESLTSEPTKPEQLEPEPTKPEQLEPDPTEQDSSRPEIGVTMFCVAFVSIVKIGKLLFQTKSVPKADVSKGSNSGLKDEVESLRDSLRTVKKDLRLDEQSNLQEYVMNLKATNQKLFRLVDQQKKLSPVREAIDSLKESFGGDPETKIVDRRRYLQNFKLSLALQEKNVELKHKIKLSKCQQLMMIKNFVELDDLLDLMKHVEIDEISKRLGEATFELKVQHDLYKEWLGDLRNFGEKFKNDYDELHKEISQEQERDLATEVEISELWEKCDQLELSDSIDDLKRKVADKAAETDKYYRDYINNYYWLHS